MTKSIATFIIIAMVSGFIGWHLCKYEFYYRYYNDTQAAALGGLGDDE